MLALPSIRVARRLNLRVSRASKQHRMHSRALGSLEIPSTHEERTATEPRESILHSVRLSRIDTVNESVRLLRLTATDRKNGIKFLPGQWLDVYVPGIPKAGGFTITSTPAEALPPSTDEAPQSEDAPFLELAVQKSPRNPPAAWLWRAEEDILHTELRVRVGGSFVWPPTGVNLGMITRILFVAGGVGINPLISILSYLIATRTMPEDVRFFYSTRLPVIQQRPGEVLFLSRLLKLLDIAESCSSSRLDLQLFVTDTQHASDLDSRIPKVHHRRISEADLKGAVGDNVQMKKTIVYVCGPPVMTDRIVSYLRNQVGMEEKHVLCEKWW